MLPTILSILLIVLHACPHVHSQPSTPASSTAGVGTSLPLRIQAGISDIIPLSPAEAALGWQSDIPFATGGAESWLTAGTTVKPSPLGSPLTPTELSLSLFRSNRFGAPLSYLLPVPSPGTYRLRLLYAENYWNATGRRIFNVTVQNVTVVHLLDLNAVGGREGEAATVGAVGNLTVTTAYAVEVMAVVGDGLNVLRIDFVPVVDLPVICGVDVFATTSSSSSSSSSSSPSSSLSSSSVSSLTSVAVGGLGGAGTTAITAASVNGASTSLSSPLSRAAVAGIAVGGIILALVFLCLILACQRKLKVNQAADQPSPTSTNEERRLHNQHSDDYPPSYQWGSRELELGGAESAVQYSEKSQSASARPSHLSVAH